MAKTGILFVCMGNICRSPTAEGVFRAHAARAGIASRLHIDSAGTHDYYIGGPPDWRATHAAQHRGTRRAACRARTRRPGESARCIARLFTFGG